MNYAKRDSVIQIQAYIKIKTIKILNATKLYFQNVDSFELNAYK